MEMGRLGAAVTIRMRRVAGETPTLTRLQRVPLPCKHNQRTTYHYHMLNHPFLMRR